MLCFTHHVAVCLFFCLSVSNFTGWADESFVLDQQLTLQKHATAVAKLCNHHAQAMRHIRRLLTPDLAQTLACSLILSRIDCCNALLHGTPAVMIHKLHWVQNNTARIVFQAPRWSDAKPLLCRLHWLPKETSTRGSSTRWSCWCSRFGIPPHQPHTAAYRRCAQTRPALHCWHNHQGEWTSQQEASITRHLLSGTHFLGQFLTVPHWQFLNLGLKLTCFTWLRMTVNDWPDLTFSATASEVTNLRWYNVCIIIIIT